MVVSGMMGWMAAFLTDAWLEALAVAAHGDEELRAATAGVALTVQQVVTGADGDDVAWYVRMADGDVEVRAGRAADADVVIIESADTAAAISRGGLSPAEAFASGRLKLGGQVGLLVRHQQAFGRLAAAVAAVHESTTYASSEAT
jgi:putative sterol carrier protein